MLMVEKQNSGGQILQGAIRSKREHVRGTGAIGNWLHLPLFVSWVYSVEHNNM